ncbi:MAG: helix-turn-helix domain-containing protein [Pseudomonadota bacterium]
MPRRPNARAIKRHRSYTVDEAARALGIAKGTVRRWLKAGLPALTEQRPALILGRDLVAFLGRRAATKATCELHEAWCFSCRAPRAPAYGEVEYHALTPTSGNMRALCEACTTVMHKRVSANRLGALRALVTVAVRHPEGRIDKGHGPCLNDHFGKDRAA